jgi:hypothetical protein
MKIDIGKYKEDNEKRKINIRIDPYDVWNMDGTLALIIHTMLLTLKKDKKGSPFIENDDVPERICSYNCSTKKDETDEFWHERWEWVIDEMIFAFEHHANPDWENSIDINNDKCIYETNADHLSTHTERMENGRRLFAKYYNALWN